MSLPWASLVAENPRFARTGIPVSGTDWVRESVRAGAAQFQLPEKQLAQLWWYSFCGGVVSPAVHLMVGYDAIPSLDLGLGELVVDGFWCGFTTSHSAGSFAEAGAELEASAGPLIDVLCSSFSLRPAPLWAIVGDSLRQSALEAGNNVFDPALGLTVARGLTSASSRFGDVPYSAVVDGSVLSVEGEVDDDMFVFAPRISCCLIYRSPGSGLCTSCPKRPAARREVDMCALADQLF